jgi:predicted amidophosphoribosyltransferase
MYEFGVSNVILKAKEERNKCAQKIIATSLFRAISFLRPKEVQDFVIVPIPSTPQAIRKRGESFLQPILDLVIQQAAHVGEKWYWRELLVHSKKVRDQAGLTSQQRQVNLEGVFRLRDGAGELRPIIVVDDVVTTGATLSNAISALNERKMTVLGAATACASSHQLLIR